MNVVVIHGYSSSADSIRATLGLSLTQASARRAGKSLDLSLHYADYVSLDDQVQLEDVAESLFLELQSKGLLQGANRHLNFVVHSTGGLVVRQLLLQYEWMHLQDLVSSIVFVAPANFGSPLASKGKSQLGRLKTIISDGIFGSNHYVSELQYGEVGEQILTDLELASPRQWRLSDFDLFNQDKGCLYGADGIHAAVFVGAESHSPASIIADLDGTDGVIVTSGAGLSVRRLELDVMRESALRETRAAWAQESTWALPCIPQLVLPTLNHGSILTNDLVADLVLDTLAAESADEFTTLVARIDAEQERQFNNRLGSGGGDSYQQLVFHVLDDRGRAITDYDISCTAYNLGTFDSINQSLPKNKRVALELGKPLLGAGLSADDFKEAVDADLSAEFDKAIRAHAYAHSQSPQFRRFLLNYSKLSPIVEGKGHIITFNVIAWSGDTKVHYSTNGVNNIVVHAPSLSTGTKLFYPNTTTQIRLTLDRYSDQGKVVVVSNG